MIYTLALLLPLSFAALVSEYAGVLAVFLEGLFTILAIGWEYSFCR